MGVRSQEAVAVLTLVRWVLLRERGTWPGALDGDFWNIRVRRLGNFPHQVGFESAIAKGTLQTPPPTIPAKPNCHNGSEPLAPIVMPKTGMNMVNTPTLTTDLNRNMNLNLLDFRAE